MTVENNVINDSSWPVRGVACEFRYNLGVVGAGHEFLWADSNASVHHNIFVGGQSEHREPLPHQQPDERTDL